MSEKKKDYNPVCHKVANIAFLDTGLDAVIDCTVEQFKGIMLHLQIEVFFFDQSKNSFIGLVNLDGWKVAFKAPGS